MLKSIWIKGLTVLLIIVGISKATPRNITAPTPEVKSAAIGIAATSTPEPTTKSTDSPTPTVTNTSAPTPKPTLMPTIRPTARPAFRPTTAPTLVPVIKTSGSADYYTNVDGQKVQSPVFSENIPDGASAKCRDGSYSFSTHRSGTCSGHGGVATWY